MKKNCILLIFISLFILFILFNIIFILPKILSRNQPYDITTQAIENECNYCLNEPPCCSQITSQLQKADDLTDLPDDQQPYHACDWPIRGYCQPSTCNQLPSGIKYRGRCGWYWTFHDVNGNDAHLGTNSQTGYGCMIGLSESTMQPRCTPQDEITLAPTGALPSPTIYIPPAIIPTAMPQPTKEIIEPTQSTIILKIVPTFDMRPSINAFPTTITLQNIPPSQSSQFKFPSIQFPKLTLPKAQINLVQINQLAQKSMGIIEYIFRRILYYDKKLENTVNEQLRKL